MRGVLLFILPNLHTLRPNARPIFAKFAEIVLAMGGGDGRVSGMNLTKTQKAVLLKLAGKVESIPYSCNHENRAFDALRSGGLAEWFQYETPAGICTGRRLTDAGKEAAENAT
jgi:hypothetical protein